VATGKGINQSSDGSQYLAVAFLLFVFLSQPVTAAEPQTRRMERPLLLAHYMPWYAAKPFSKAWGWHWTMNHFNPDLQINGQRQIASKFQPLIGPYDSGDPTVIEFHLLTMRMAGIDGVIVDWYGLTDFRDYAELHRNTTRVLQCCEWLGMKFVICYEDQTIPALVQAGRVQQADRVSHAAGELAWLGRYWFRSGAYVRQQGRPLLLSFGQAGLTDAEWTNCLQQSATDVVYVSQHHRRTAAAGAFDWPVSQDADRAWDRFMKQSATGDQSIPVALPRFVDVYAEAGTGKSYGLVADDGGRRFRRQLEQAMRSGAAVVQIATWNDWGEGTMVEPSVEFGYRDLEAVRAVLQQFLPATSTTPADTGVSDSLRLPAQLVELRRRAADEQQQKRCDEIAAALAQADLQQAALLLRSESP